jgi:hypothetical protein
MTMRKPILLVILLLLGLFAQSGAASACPGGYRQCGSYCCGGR